MASSVFYKFKSQRDESRITFDGTGISVFDLKREIILANNLSKANDFDLHLYDSKTDEEFTDDSQIIQRSSSVIAKRLPAKQLGRGNASYYTAGSGTMVPLSESVSRPGGHAWHKGAMSKRFDGKDEQPKPAAQPIVASSIQPEDEAAAMAAMFQAQTANWEETQERMSQATPINNPRGGAPSRGGKPFQAGVSDRPLPPSYVCYRCGQKGHWIKDCPTNSDRDYDNRPRIKRTTGIPRSMLKTVENPDVSQLGQGIMVTPEGGYVVAQPDSASWQKQVSQKKGLTPAEVRERTPTDPSLICPIDNALFRDAVKTPCCGTTYCEDCIQSHLLERDFICPSCNKKVPSLDKLETDKPTRTKVVDYIDRVIEESKRESGPEETSILLQSNEDPNDQELYTEQQPGMDMTMEMSQIVESIPQIQAQIAQISLMLSNPSLPKAVRQTTEMQHQQLQMQLQQAQAVSAALTTFQQQQSVQNLQNANVAAAGYGMNMGQAGPKWTNPYSSQPPAGMDSAYQRLPLNNRRRNLKRERPSDFLEVAGEAKSPKYWE